MKKAFLLAAVAALVFSGAASANMLMNGTFDDAVLGAGQTPVPVGGWKLLINDPAHPDYAGHIEAVAHWDNFYQFDNNTKSDQGLSRNTDFGGSETEQFAFINNWNRRFSQTVSDVVEEGVTYTATIDFNAAALDLDRAGDFTLFAGGMDPANPDNPAPGTIQLATVSIGNQSYIDNEGPVDILVEDTDWHMVTLEYTANAGDPAIGMPLTVSFRTKWGCAGQTYWDNAVLTPEPASLLVLALGGLMLRRR